MTTTSSMTVSLGIPSDAAALDGVRELERQRLRGLLRQRMFGQQAAPVRIGRFQIRRKLGEGAAGVVYAAFDPQMERQVALKVLMAQVADRRALIREARALAQLSHPNVLTIYEVNDESDLAYIVSELVEEGSLRDWMREPRTAAERSQMLLGIGQGVASAHRAGLVHRDLKPENVLVGDGRPRIADFGLARVWAAESGTLSGGTRVVGTPAYMPPEQRRGEAPNPKNDQYSFGVMGYELLFERHPFLVPAAKGDDLASPRFDPAAAIAPPASRHPCAAAWPVLERALRADPGARWPDVQALLGALDAAVPRATETPGRPRKARLLALAAVAAVLGLLVVGAWWRPWASSEPVTTEPSVADTGPDNARDVALFQAVRPMMDRMDWTGCADYLAEHANTETSRATWVTCAQASRDEARLDLACAAASRDPSPPAQCDAVVSEARQLHRTGRFQECVKVLWEAERTSSRSLVLFQCTSSLEGAARVFACMYGQQLNGQRGAPADCGLGEGILLDANGASVPVPEYAIGFALDGRRAACEKIASEHGQPDLAALCASPGSR
ncbi:MAG: serine/threonine protein kinase [Sandaracinaceae bacterium]|nr:serine/threonine protein kinase [Sandaracinaceae bacterium]